MDKPELVEQARLELAVGPVELSHIAGLSRLSQIARPIAFSTPIWKVSEALDFILSLCGSPMACAAGLFPAVSLLCSRTARPT